MTGRVSYDWREDGDIVVALRDANGDLIASGVVDADEARRAWLPIERELFLQELERDSARATLPPRYSEDGLRDVYRDDWPKLYGLDGTWFAA